MDPGRECQFAARVWIQIGSCEEAAGNQDVYEGDKEQEGRALAVVDMEHHKELGLQRKVEPYVDVLHTGSLWVAGVVVGIALLEVAEIGSLGLQVYLGVLHQYESLSGHKSRRGLQDRNSECIDAGVFHIVSTGT